MSAVGCTPGLKWNFLHQLARMYISRYKFPSRLLVLSNEKYFFEDLRYLIDARNIVYEFDCNNIASVYITSVGEFCFNFYDFGRLCSVDTLRHRGDGVVPEQVLENEEVIHQLQEKRILFINFVIAVFFGRISGKRRTSICGAVYNGQDRVDDFNIAEGKISAPQADFATKNLQRKIKTLEDNKLKYFLLSSEEVEDAISYVQKVLSLCSSFECVNLERCMVMNYQAAILHEQQQASASLVLNFLVIESLVQELFYAYGLINGSTVKPFAIRKHEISNMSKKQFKGSTANQLIESLHEGKLIDEYLYQRIDEARTIRNRLMHRGGTLSPRESGEIQTVVRDLWSFFVDAPFELAAGWSYRR